MPCPKLCPMSFWECWATRTDCWRFAATIGPGRPELPNAIQAFWSAAPWLRPAHVAPTCNILVDTFGNRKRGCTLLARMLSPAPGAVYRRISRRRVAHAGTEPAWTERAFHPQPSSWHAVIPTNRQPRRRMKWTPGSSSRMFQRRCVSLHVQMVGPAGLEPATGRL